MSALTQGGGAPRPPIQFENVNVVCKANVYFDGGVVSHTVLFKDGTKKTLGVIRPGTFKFNTDVAEQMDILSGVCRVKLPKETAWKAFTAGTSFQVPAKSLFEITLESGFCEYICSYLK
ncbi:MAG TPA: pyrimidine/purine nucleoside phosphorylase [Kiritimatiellia bacterium]|jgi:hypothetical protein